MKSRKVPKPQRLRYERPDGRPVYCELCKNTIKVGDLFAWWELEDNRPTMYCLEKGCHWANVRAGKPLR
jgi:hypothetical protein